MKFILILIKKSEVLSALSMRVVKLTGKSKERIHPKHLVKKEKFWFKTYLKKDDILLDLGCGIGSDSVKSATLVNKVIGLDIDKSSLKIANSQKKILGLTNLEFLTHDLNKKIPFRNDSFTKIICSDVLEHIIKREQLLGEMKRVLKNQGKLLLVTDNPETSWKKKLKKHNLFYYADRDHKYEYPKDEILQLLKKNKFRVNSVNVVSLDTPFKGFIDLIGGFSLTAYQSLSNWKMNELKKNPKETSGYKIIATITK